MSADIIVVISGTKEFKILDTKSGGQLSRALKEVKDGIDGITLTCPNKIDAKYVRIETTKIETANDARTFGGRMFNMFKNFGESMQFNVSTKFNTEINEGVNLSSYQFTKYKSEPKMNTLKTVLIDNCSGEDISESINHARDFITEPGNKLYPAVYAERIKELLEPLGVTVEVYDQSALKHLGHNLLLSVGQGSTKDSYVVTMEFKNGAKNDGTIALVGKGVCFDSGGISLKPGKGMGDMKYDMAGSAAVVGAMHALAKNNIKKNVVAIVGLVENMPDGDAIKPGDVVKSLSGLTVENLNTDAEGRLVLADLLTHVQKQYNPSTIIDLATLTGAIMVALGTEMAGLFTNSTSLEKEIIKAGNLSDEHFWRMPMGKQWNKMIDSDIADMQNIGGSYGGSTTAAEFLYRFVDEDRAWAHLDIAGMAWEESGKPTTPKGAAGFGIRTLYNLVKDGKLKKLDIDDSMKY